MIRRSATSICIFTLIFNVAFLNAQEEESGLEEATEVNLIEEDGEIIGEQVEAESLNTSVAEEESLSVQTVNVVEPDTASPVQEEALKKKTFQGTGKDVILAATSILGWLFFMWLTANQRD